eukprot:238304-Rhodomonas_salina.2
MSGACFATGSTGCAMDGTGCAMPGTEVSASYCALVPGMERPQPQVLSECATCAQLQVASYALATPPPVLT